MEQRTNRFVLIVSALVMLIVIGLLFILYEPEPLTLDDLAHIQLGWSFEEIAWEIGGGDWVSDAEFFTIAYEVEGRCPVPEGDVEGGLRLVLVFEDGIHLSMATLHRPDGTTAIMGGTSTPQPSGK